MASVTEVVGIDPGVVHTGLVRLVFDTGLRSMSIRTRLMDGVNAAEIKAWVDDSIHRRPYVFVEKYRPRHNFSTDSEMIRAERELKVAMPAATLISNTGSLSTVTPGLLRLLNLWEFRPVSHHQDLRSAARIAVLGMMKDSDLNRMLADMVDAELKGDPWEIRKP
jgi:hypothetical protein